MKIKPNKENIVNDMLIELNKGISYTNCLALNSTKWNLPKTTFVRYWNTANERHKQAQEATQKVLADISIEAEKERLKKAILTKEQRMEILTSIALGEIPLTKPMIVDGVINNVPVVPNWTDRKNAIAELNKMDGGYSPIKNEMNVSGSVTTNEFTEEKQARLDRLIEKALAIKQD